MDGDTYLYYLVHIPIRGKTMSKNKPVETASVSMLNEPMGVQEMSGYKTRTINGKLVQIHDKTPEERQANFEANLSHESDRVEEWSAKLLTHATSTAYAVSEEAMAVIVDRYTNNYNDFMSGIAKFKMKGVAKTDKPSIFAGIAVVKKE